MRDGPPPLEDDEERAALRKSMYAGRLARDLVLQRAAHNFLKVVLNAAPTPGVGKLAAGILIDFAISQVKD